MFNFIIDPRLCFFLMFVFCTYLKKRRLDSRISSCGKMCMNSQTSITQRRLNSRHTDTNMGERYRTTDFGVESRDNYRGEEYSPDYTENNTEKSYPLSHSRNRKQNRQTESERYSDHDEKTNIIRKQPLETNYEHKHDYEIDAGMEPNRDIFVRPRRKSTFSNRCQLCWIMIMNIFILCGFILLAIRVESTYDYLKKRQCSVDGDN